MKYLFFIILSFTLSQSVFSQELDFVGMHGLRDDSGDLYFKYRNYSISVSDEKGKIGDEITRNEIIDKYTLGTIIANYEESYFNFPNQVIESESVSSDNPNVDLANACYLFQQGEDKIEVILFQTLTQRDVLLERAIINAYHQGRLDQFVDVGNGANSINFAGRIIELGDLCEWQSPNNVSCEEGQISWSEFSTYQDAIIELQACVIANESTDNNILLDEDVDVVFEGIKTVARRIVYMPPAQNYPLTVYYVVQEVRGRFISCVLSNYGYDKDDYQLSPLLEQVMYFETLPNNSISDFKVAEREEYYELDEYQVEESTYIASVRAGAWLPMGNTTHLYNWAPSISASIGMPIKQVMAVDLILGLTFPVGRKNFNYHLDRDYILDAKADALMNMGVRFRYQKTIARNVYFTPYVGVGYHVLVTNQIEEFKNDDGDDVYHNMGTLNLFAGVDLRIKKIGVFLEYQYTPYHLSKHARNDIGNSHISTGIYFAFW